MSLKEFLDFIAKEIEEDGKEKRKPLTDYIIDFLVIDTPKALYSEILKTYSWTKDGVILAIDSIAEKYKQWHDARIFSKNNKK